MQGRICIQPAEELKKLMFDRGLVPDYITYTILITRVMKTFCADEILVLHDYMILGRVIPDYI